MEGRPSSCKGWILRTHPQAARCQGLLPGRWMCPWRRGGAGSSGTWNLVEIPNSVKKFFVDTCVFLPRFPPILSDGSLASGLIQFARFVGFVPPEHGHNEDIESEVDVDNEDEVDVDLLTLLLLLHHRSVLGSLQGSHRAATVCLWIT